MQNVEWPVLGMCSDSFYTDDGYAIIKVAIKLFSMHFLMVEKLSAGLYRKAKCVWKKKKK